ncbi:sugar phosphate isomerase/epimerase family protein [Verrucomicrobiota bacterium]
MTANTIACRPGCFEGPLSEALALVKAAGIDNVEAGIPGDGNFSGLAELCRDKGLTITTLAGGVDLGVPESVAAVEKAIEGAAEIGTRVIFLSASIGSGVYDDGIPVLGRLARAARAVGVVLSIETHLPFAYNGDLAKRTIELVNSPGIGHNFDTANIYYYNPKGIDAVEELRKVLPYVTSVHLKESERGEPESMNFPPLGKGIVDFPSVFRLLGERGFYGPYTLELEGPLLDGLSKEARSDIVRECLAYLTSIGAAK